MFIRHYFVSYTTSGENGIAQLYGEFVLTAKWYVKRKTVIDEARKQARALTGKQQTVILAISKI